MKSKKSKKSKKPDFRRHQFLWQITAAIDDDHTEALEAIISDPAFEEYAEGLLGEALTESSKSFKVKLVEYLLDKGAPVEGSPDSPSPLLLAARDQDPDAWPEPWVHNKEEHRALAEYNARCRTAIIELLLSHGAKTEAVDEEGRTALLITSVAASEEVDPVAIMKLLLQRKANTEAADKEGRTSIILALHQKRQPIVDLLINYGANVNATDQLQRNALHLIAMDDGPNFQEWHSTVTGLLRRNIHTSGLEGEDHLGRTPLHWACAMDKVVLAEQLLSVSELEARDGQSETALHVAAKRGTTALVTLLISHKADVNARSDGGWTPVHLACGGGNIDTVRALLKAGADVNAILLNKMSSLHLAAQAGHLEVVRLLLAHQDFKPSTKDAFNKTAFMRAAQNKHNNIVRILDPTKLPASVSTDVVGACKCFEATIVDFGDYSNGIRSRTMTIFDLLHQREFTNSERSAFSINPEGKQPAFTWVHFPANNVSWIETFLTKWFIENDCHDFEQYQTLLDSLAQQEEGDYAYSHFMRPSTGASTKALDDPPDPWSSLGRKKVRKRNIQSVFAHIPYLHFETALKRREMKDAIQRKETEESNTQQRTFDEMLIRGYLNNSTSSLNVRRTLDESFNPNIRTSARDEDQVVFEHQRNIPVPSKKLIMVDQLWIWVVGSNLVLTSFPQRWQHPKNDEFNIIDEIKEQLNSWIGVPDVRAQDLALTITERAIDAVNGMGFWNAYNSYISQLKEDETSLYNQFNADSLRASTWRKYQKSSKAMDWHEIERHGPSSIDSLLEIENEIALLSRVQKIREELMMVSRILEDQLLVLPDFEKSLHESFENSQHGTLQSRIKSIESRIRDIDRMDKQAERVYASITDLLDRKQKSATVFQARLMSDQVTGSAKKREKTVLVFTIVTILFLPLSFIASFFTMNIAEFPKDPDGLPLAYVSKYIFGIGLTISMLLILITFSLDDLWGFFRAARQKLVKHDSEVVSKQISVDSNLTDMRFRGRRRGDVETALEALPIDVESKSSSISIN